MLVGRPGRPYTACHCLHICSLVHEPSGSGWLCKLHDYRSNRPVRVLSFGNSAQGVRSLGQTGFAVPDTLVEHKTRTHTHSRTNILRITRLLCYKLARLTRCFSTHLLTHMITQQESPPHEHIHTNTYRPRPRHSKIARACVCIHMHVNASVRARACVCVAAVL